MRFFELFGIDFNHIIFLNEPRIFKKVILPDQSYIPLKGYKKDYFDIIGKIVESCDKTDFKYKKIYFSRAKFAKTNHNEFGENQITSLFAKNEFKIIYPEELSLDEQINMINSCDIFVTAGGSLAHNVIFRKDKNMRMFLFNRMDGYQWHQWMFNEMSGIQLNYIDSYCCPYRFIMKTSISGPFLYSVNKNVRLFAKDYGLIVPHGLMVKKISSFLSYSLRFFHTVISKLMTKRNN